MWYRSALPPKAGQRKKEPARLCSHMQFLPAVKTGEYVQPSMCDHMSCAQQTTERLNFVFRLQEHGVSALWYGAFRTEFPVGSDKGFALLPSHIITHLPVPKDYVIVVAL